MNDVELAIRLTADASDAADAFGDAGSAAKGMASDIDSASKKADSATDRLSSVAESADNLDSKAAQATGSLGALSSGFELVGAEKYAGTLQSAAMATDFLAGVGEGLNLVMELQIVQTARAKAAAIAHTVATKAQSAATKAAAAAQWLMNIALSANPIGAIIAGVLLLVGGFILLYKRSDRFRTIVQAVMKAATIHIRLVIKVVLELVAWVRDKLPAAWEAARDKVADVARRIRDGVGSAFDWIRDKVRTILSFVVDKFVALRERVVSIGGGIRDTMVRAFEAISAPIEKAIGLVKELIEWIKDIDLPSLGDLNPFGKISNPLGRQAIGGSSGPTTVTNHITITGVLDAYDAAEAMQQLLLRHARAMGYTTA